MIIVGFLYLIILPSQVLCSNFDLHSDLVGIASRSCEDLMVVQLVKELDVGLYG